MKKDQQLMNDNSERQPQEVLPSNVDQLRTRANRKFSGHRRTQTAKKWGLGVIGASAALMGANSSAVSNVHQATGKVLKHGELRWSVKTGSDIHAKEVNMTPEDISAASLVAIPRPQQFPASLRPQNGLFDDVRFAPAELKTFRVHATITAFKIEADGDFHLAMQGDDGTPFVAEVVKPSFAVARDDSTTSIWLPQITNVRTTFLNHFGIKEPTAPGSQFTSASDHVIITGVAYFDDDEKQRNESANTIEIHPILSMDFE